jgi:hypothetical protein
MSFFDLSSDFLVPNPFHILEQDLLPAAIIELRAAADALARALTLDMASWWQPTAANYFARIKKDQILQAIQEATGAPVKERLRSLKETRGPLTKRTKCRARHFVHFVRSGLGSSSYH